MNQKVNHSSILRLWSSSCFWNSQPSSLCKPISKHKIGKYKIGKYVNGVWVCVCVFSLYSLYNIKCSLYNIDCYCSLFKLPLIKTQGRKKKKKAGYHCHHYITASFCSCVFSFQWTSRHCCCLIAVNSTELYVLGQLSSTACPYSALFWEKKCGSFLFTSLYFQCTSSIFFLCMFFCPSEWQVPLLNSIL